jgi:hypothetical protein
MFMNTKLVFAVSYQGETEYKVCGGEYDGRTLRVYYAKEAHYLDMMRFLRTPLERNMMEQASRLAGTVSFIGGEEVSLELLNLARRRQRCATTLSPEIAALELKAAKLAQDGTWVIYEPEAHAMVRHECVRALHPIFAAAREAAEQRRSAVASA